MVSAAAPDIRDLSSSLRVSRINLSGGGVAVDVTFNVSLVRIAKPV